jgi:chromosome segregation ATPase
MGLKDMFRTGSKHSQDSPTPSAKPSPKTSRAGTPLRETRDDVSVASRASSSGMPSREEQAGEKARSEDKGASDKVADLEKELSTSRWEAMMMRDKIAELEHKLETAQMPGGWAPFPSEEQRAKEEALEERNTQLREKVRDLQEELERLQEGNSHRSSTNDKSAGTDISANRGSEPAHEARAKDDEEKKQMAVRIKELEAKLEEHQSSVFGENFVGLQARIKTLEEQLRESREDMDEVLKERDELKEALQDAGGSRMSVECLQGLCLPPRLQELPTPCPFFSSFQCA